MARLAQISFLIFLCSCAKNTESSSQSSGGNEDDFSIVSTQLINWSATDLCTEFSGDSCTFDGGQLVTFSNGLLYFTGMFSRVYVSGSDTDTDSHSVGMFIPSGANGGYMVLNDNVARGSGLKYLFIVYTKSTGLVTIVHDTNNNLAYEAGSDTVLLTPTLTASP